MKITNSPPPLLNGSKLKIAIILPYFNESLGLKLYEKTISELQKNQVSQKQITLFRTSGSLELPFAAQKIINRKNPDVIIALGIVIRGKTSHYELVIGETYRGLMQVQLEAKKPIIFGVLGCENIKQVKERLDKGEDFASAAIIQAQI